MYIPLIGEVRIKKYMRIFFAIFTLLYILSPIDFIPDVIPVIGWIDDIILAILGFSAVFGGEK